MEIIRGTDFINFDDDERKALREAALILKQVIYAIDNGQAFESAFVPNGYNGINLDYLDEVSDIMNSVVLHGQIQVNRKVH